MVAFASSAFLSAAATASLLLDYGFLSCVYACLGARLLAFALGNRAARARQRRLGGAEAA